ncbi:dihydrolipoyl dehydrogenase [bacterium]|nr:dihydrolipoyl dehydrogenase [bacterium]
MSYDVAVIGAGPGGYIAAVRAAQLGLSVVCVEKEERLGGVCLRVGCIPSKALLESSELYYKAGHEFKTHGIAVSPELDLAQMQKRKDGIVDALTKGVAHLFKTNKIEHIAGTAKFVGPGKVEVDGKPLDARNIVIATGSSPASLPGVDFDGERIVDSTGALSFEDVPGEFIVIGGGAIGLEMGSVWSRLGARVTVLEYMPQIVPGMDAELAKQATRILKKQGLTIETGVRVTGAKVADGKVTVTAQGAKEGDEPRTWAADKVLVSVGRRPNSANLGLDAAGVEVNERGFIKVDEHWRTSAGNVYAIGDVTPGPMLAHKASEEGVAVAEILAGGAGHVNYDVIPAVVYTDPEFASVGKTEDQLKEAGVEYKAGQFPYLPNGRAKALNAKDGFVKILTDAKTDRILGAHLIGTRAGDLVAEIVVAMEFSGSAEDLGRTVHAHPSLPEIVKEAALAAWDRPLHS